MSHKRIDGDYLRDMADMMRVAQPQGHMDWILWQILQTYMVLDIHMWEHSAAGTRRAWAVFRETVYPRDHLKGDALIYELRDDLDSATLHQATIPATELEQPAARLAAVHIPLSSVGDAVGSDSTWYGLEMHRVYATARLQWWSDFPREWVQLRHAAAEFRGFLEQTIEERGELVVAARGTDKA